LRAALMARAGFSGPRTVFEGTHGLFHGFAHKIDGDYDALLGDFGTRWVTETLAFKPYPCGTMTHPYIDCARRLFMRAASSRAGDGHCLRCGREAPCIASGSPLAAKQKPANGLCGKVLAAVLHRGRSGARQCGARPISLTRR
jgi:hypothetical protein